MEMTWHLTLIKSGIKFRHITLSARFDIMANSEDELFKKKNMTINRQMNWHIDNELPFVAYNIGS